MMSNLKFVGLFIINFLLSVAPTFVIRRFILRFIGFTIGRDVTIHRGLRLFGLKKVTIGSSTTINHSVYLDNRREIYIGNNVTISHDARIYTLGHDIDSPQFNEKGGGVSISDNCIIFAGAKIMPGVHMDEGSVLFPFSVLTKSTGKKEVWGGNPSVFLKLRKLESINYTSAYPQWLGN